jgi:UDP-glucuronate 4-epimerase
MADIKKLESWVDFKPKTPLVDGVNKFVDWYRTFYECKF